MLNYIPVLLVALVGLFAGWAKCLDDEPRSGALLYSVPLAGPLLSRINREGWIILLLIGIGTFATYLLGKIEQDRVNSTIEATGNYATINAFVQRIDFILHESEYKNRRIENDLSLVGNHFARGRINEARKKLKEVKGNTLSRIASYNAELDGLDGLFENLALGDKESAKLADRVELACSDLDTLKASDFHSASAMIQSTLDELHLRFRSGLSDLRSQVRFQNLSGKQVGEMSLLDQIARMLKDHGGVSWSIKANDGG